MCGNHQHHQPAVKLQAFNRNSEIPHKALPHHSFTNAIPTASKAELSTDRKQSRWDSGSSTTEEETAQIVGQTLKLIPFPRI